MREDLRRSHVFMSEQILHRAYVIAILQLMERKQMLQHVRRHHLADRRVDGIGRCVILFIEIPSSAVLLCLLPWVEPALTSSERSVYEFAANHWRWKPGSECRPGR